MTLLGGRLASACTRAKSYDWSGRRLRLVRGTFSNSWKKMYLILRSAGLRVTTMPRQCQVFVHGGLQRKIREVNPKALFSPCFNYSLNLCAVHAFACVPSSVTCFGTVEKIYSFFSSSTQKWQLLKEKTGKNLKRLSDTRWSAYYKLRGLIHLCRPGPLTSLVRHWAGPGFGRAGARSLSSALESVL
ncbi:hypothetical protein EVAR_22642_1 [Eumeta japonica]|uniref:Uncharacterized protein n=1 Tax=Eumeta variegata TaxID=151549 RepID=A0A4C1VJF4_EUMVA|nr:hypothetical protein EVAR_22642_1 [Eumeta japonica]